jgi:hypothetical protein
MGAFVEGLCAQLDVDLHVDIDQVLDTAKEAAHAVFRPAAPLATFLLGYALAAHPDATAEELAAAVRRFCVDWGAAQPTDPVTPE